MTGARERKKGETRARLRRAAVDLGLERGMGAVSVEEIAARAGVSTRTFFNYFDGKDDAVLLPLFTVTDAELGSIAAGSLWSDLTRLFADDIERVAGTGPDLPRYLELQERHPAVQARQMGVFGRFDGRLAAAIATRLDPASTGPPVALRAGVVSGSCITAVRVGLAQWALHGWRGSARGPVESAFALLAPAFHHL